MIEVRGLPRRAAKQPRFVAEQGPVNGAFDGAFAAAVSALVNKRVNASQSFSILKAGLSQIMSERQLAVLLGEPVMEFNH